MRFNDTARTWIPRAWLERLAAASSGPGVLKLTFHLDPGLAEFVLSYDRHDPSADVETLQLLDLNERTARARD